MIANFPKITLDLCEARRTRAIIKRAIDDTAPQVNGDVSQFLGRGEIAYRAMLAGPRAAPSRDADTGAPWL
jgi:hypothetical protein